MKRKCYSVEFKAKHAAETIRDELTLPDLRAFGMCVLRAVIREPLMHFVVIGAAIFLAVHVAQERSSRYRIAIGAQDIERIAGAYAQQYGARPDRGQLRAMLDAYVRDEIYVREGIALGLDRDDEIVRRRLAQKYQFLQQDLAAAREPDEARLRAWYAGHRADFTKPARRSFEHLYIAADQRGDSAARQIAEAAAAALRSGRPAPAGDAFPGPAVTSDLTADDVIRLFGDEAFARDLFAAPVGRWDGPFRSGFGWHVVRVTQARPARPRSFEEARADAGRAWREADRHSRNAERYRKLRARYTVDVTDDAQGAGS